MSIFSSVCVRDKTERAVSKSAIYRVFVCVEIKKRKSGGVLTKLAVVTQVSPGVLTLTHIWTPTLLTQRTILTGIGVAAGFAVLGDGGQVDGDVSVDVQDLAVHHQAAEATDQAIFYISLAHQLTAKMPIITA